MSSTFSRSHGSAVASFDQAEAELLRHLLEQLLALLDDGDQAVEDDPLARAVGIGTSTAPPDDPALARLFPDGYRDDDAASAEFRRYTEGGLREGKRADARVALATLEHAGKTQPLDPPTAQSWLRTLTSLRLVLGTRLEVTEETEALWEVEADDEDDPRAATMAVYAWLGWLQETLVRALR